MKSYLAGPTLLLSFTVLAVASFTIAPSISFRSFERTNLITSTTMSAAESSDDVIAPAETIGLVVECEIKPERMTDFLELIEKNAQGSRAEAGCLRFGK